MEGKYGAKLYVMGVCIIYKKISKNNFNDSYSCTVAICRLDNL